MKSRILIVEDEPGLVLVITDLLRNQGHQVDAATHVGAALTRVTQTAYDLLILDVMLPDGDGFELCRRAREAGFDGAILMLTAKGEVRDRVQGFRSGTDDYVIKPFHPDELLARVSALLRRLKGKQLSPSLDFHFGDVRADFSRMEFFCRGEPVCLAAKEADLLRFLIHARGRVLSRQEILKEVWPKQPYITARTVDVHIAWLRQKLEDQPDAPRHILTVRGEGYVFRA